MISISWKRIRNQKYKSVMTIATMITIILLTSYGLQTAKETQFIVTDNLENYSRGSYDLLVRPEGARTEIEEHLQTVEENYIGRSEERRVGKECRRGRGGKRYK